MSSGARASARFTLRRNEMLKMSDPRFHFARRSGVNAAPRVQRRLVTHLREIQ